MTIDNEEEVITLGHGAGGVLTGKLVRDIFLNQFNNQVLSRLGDAALLDIDAHRMAFTTDSFVISPLFFKGGDIGRLSVCGTVNDLAVMGAEPLFIAAGFIIGEGFSLRKLEAIAQSMRAAADEAGVAIVTGDTKVVRSQDIDELFITTSGIGRLDTAKGLSARPVTPGDTIIISGTVGEHGMSIFIEREAIALAHAITSDVAPLNGMIRAVLEGGCEVRCMRDPTRGGVATALNELAEEKGVDLLIRQEHIPVSEEVAACCEILGFDPLYIANEGKALFVIDPEDAQKAIAILRKHPYGKEAQVIGSVLEGKGHKVFLETFSGAHRQLEELTEDQLPRIC
ncbi:MAG: hydrogenase expression/formation protein HypE [Candidatus Omnitrophica bacterium]|nr:hydrogenase expression/formation protein HypE [Candidatus Omnitrophota bacterium]